MYIFKTAKYSYFKIELGYPLVFIYKLKINKINK